MMRGTGIGGRLREQRYLLAILAVALCTRLAFALWFGDRMENLSLGGTDDQITYDTFAQRLATGHGFTVPVSWYPWIPPETPTAYFSRTEILHLAAIYYVFGYHPLIARLLYAILGTLSCYFIYCLGRRLFGRPAGLVASALAAVYAYLIVYNTVLLTETPFIFCVLAALVAAYRVAEGEGGRLDWLWLGLALGGAALFRQAILPFDLLLLAWLWLQLRRPSLARPALTAAPGSSAGSVFGPTPGPHRPAPIPHPPATSRPAHILISLTVIVLAILPWTVLNYVQTGRFMLLESQFGHVFWAANHPSLGTDWSNIAHYPRVPSDLAPLNEADKTNELLRQGIGYVLSDPGRFVKLTLSRSVAFFTFWPTAGSGTASNLARVLSFGVTLPFMLYGLVLSLRRWRRCLPLYLFLVLHLGVYLASWVMIRYRIPADTVLLLFAGCGIADLYARLARRPLPGLVKPGLPI